LTVFAATNPRIIGLPQALDSKSISAHVARTGQVLNIPDVSRRNEFALSAGEYSRYQANQVLSAPIFAAGRLVGVLNVTNRRDRRAYAALEEGPVNRFLDRIGLLLHQARLTEELKRRKESLDRANRELLRLEKLKRDLTDMVVHDLKGPLAEVVANLHLIAGESLSEPGREFLDSAFLGADTLSRMIMNLLDINRMEEGRLTLKPECVSLPEMAGRVKARLNSLLNLKSIQADLSLPEGLPRAWADPGLIERVFQNLLVNAVDHTPEGTGVRISAEVQGKMLLVSVADAGPGVPEGFRETIFEKFNQAPKADQPRTSTGLGLTFCRLAVAAHGGRMWVQDAPGGGADFRFTLPLAPGGQP
ncbi:MAG: ATP-binding protein, partial [Thermodesulfobacteriota bacterium]